MSIIQRQRKITKIPQEYLKPELPPPPSLKIEIVSKCNYRCSYCPICYREDDNGQMMPWDLFEKITREAKDLGIEEIGLFYIGESFLNPEYLVKAIKFLKQDLQIPYVFLTTNGSMANPEVLERVMFAGLDSLKFSCNFYSDEQFTEITGANSRLFQKSKLNIKFARIIKDHYGLKTKISSSSIKFNDKQQEKMQKFVDENIKPYVDEHYWLPLYSAGGQAEAKEGMVPTAGNTGSLNEPSAPLPCWTVFTSAHVMADGRLTACCLDATGYWTMGDLSRQSFMDAWNSKDFVELRRAHLRKDVTGTKCEKCVLMGS